MSGHSTVQDPPIRPRPGFPLTWNSTQPRPGTRLVTLTGELDISTTPLLLAALQRPEHTHATHLVISLVDVDFLAVAGINAMINTARRRPHHHTHLITAPTNKAVTRIIELTDAAELLTIHHDLEHCLHSLDQL
jgi:anti-anti-sigma factor